MNSQQYTAGTSTMQLVDPPRKPFVARGSKTRRCERCRLRVDLCICAECHTVTAGSAFWLLTHHNEFYKPSNTGRLILNTIAGSTSSEWARQEPGDAFQGLLDDPALAPCIVFPFGEDYQHRMISDPVPSDGRKPVFIILDGTWRQARRMFRHSRYLDHLPVIEPEARLHSGYRLRQAIEPGQLCTAEVAIALLQQTGDQLAAEHLASVFRLFNIRGHISRRSKMPEDILP